MDSFRGYLATVAEGRPLSREEAEAAFEVIMSGEATPAQIGGFLMALRLRGETVDEIAGAVTVMRAKMTRVLAPTTAIDVVGTGGDASGSYNISTCAAFIVAGAGVPVAKHGNRALSSRSGSADVLTALGVDVNLGPERISACIREAGIGFMFAPNHHAAMRHVGPARAELGVRTIFNLLGPLSNPAGVTRMLVGVFAESWVRPIAETLRALGAEHAWVVHSALHDEITTSGPTLVGEVAGGALREFTIEPEDFDLQRVPPAALKGGDAAHNAAALRGVLAGQTGTYRDVALLNAAAGLVIADVAPDLGAGLVQATEVLDSGAALERLERLVAVSQG